MAVLAAYSAGIDLQTIGKSVSEFNGIEHRMELFHESAGIRFYNDSAATIPQAAAAAITTLSKEGPLVLVTGGSDKNLDFYLLAQAAAKASSIILLAGKGSEKLIELLNKDGIKYRGPFDNLEKAVLAALEEARKFTGSSGGCIVALSPGCTSFEMFKNEFDRGLQWKEACIKHS